ncbi:SusC/RagA family TonB-linked outer membrane protein [Parapedobacter defluvii]|uniref:SusC/RagA family TonB-linked outer membrane protein n=2 Tax=Parapedobacter defluvii TaxID=2045106 RepID=A0ABQ1L204_9SPHI|nr:SusC/RagA family TonB-linked outer membrane protein [Parapedobacter defluvii]
MAFALLSAALYVHAQTSITGTVTDANGPIEGVTVQVTGTNRGTQTNASGHYSIEASTGETLQFSALGYTSQSVLVGASSIISVTLEEASGEIGEVVITAMGIKREARSLGYSIQKVGGEDITQANAPTVATGLMGKIAGLNISVPNGVEGGSQRVVIRGNTSISGNNQPLYVIDGMPMDNSQIASSGNDINRAAGTYQDWGSILNFINPEDIEEINVLKGPTAAALYGARGGNGVILINTKKGKLKEGLGVDYSYSLRLNDPFRFQEMQNVYGYGGAIALYSAVPSLPTDESGKLRYPGQDPWAGSGITDQRWLSQGAVPGGLNTWDYFSWYGTGASWGAKMENQQVLWWDGTVRTYSPQPDNIQSFYRNGNTQTHNVAFSGANDLGSVRVSYTRQDNTAILPNSNFNNNTFNLGSNVKISKKVTADISASYINYTRYNSPNVGDSNNSWGKFTTYGMSRDFQNIEQDLYRNADGSKNLLDGSVYPLGYPYGQYGRDIYWNTYMNNNILNRDQLLGTIKLNADLTDWLTLMGRVSGNFSSDELEKKNYPIDPEGINGKYGHEMYKTTDRNLEFLATAHRDNLGGSLFNTSISIGGSAWSTNYRATQGWNDGPFNIPYLFFLKNINKTGNATDFQPTEDRAQQKINSVFGIANISYDDFLFLELTGRNDWSSTLPARTNSYFYPAASLSYIFTENLTHKPSWIDYGKLRVAYAGSASGTNPYQTTYIYDSGTFGGQSTRMIPEKLLPLDLLKPQRSNSYELGTDLSFLQNKLGLTFTYYQVNSTSQIIDLNVAPSSGVSAVRTNSGELLNRGFEFTVRATPIRSADFSWDLTLNGAHNTNKLIALAPGIDEYYLDEMFGNNGVTMKVKVGENYGTIYGHDFTYKDGQRVVERVLDGNGNVAGTRYVVTSEQVPIGNANPKLTGGLGTNLRFKNFSLYGLFDFKWGGDIWSGSYSTAMGNGLAPETLYERDGNGLPYTYPDGTTANHGVILDGVFVDNATGEVTGVNNDVVHYMWKYAGAYAAWSSINMPRSLAVLDNSWIKLREVRLSYQVPSSVIKNTKFIQGLNLSIIGRDLFYLYTSLPDQLNPEAINGIGNAQGIEFGALPSVRSFGFSVSASF